MDPKGYFLGDLESVGVGMEFEDRSMTNIKADAFRDAIWSTSIRLGVTPAIRWQPIEETYGAQSLLVSKAGVLLYSEKELHESLN